MNDLSTDDDILSGSTESRPTGELAREFTRPAFTFRGQALRPYTAGTDLLFTQVLDRNDADLTCYLAHVMIHLESNWTTKTGEKKLAPNPALLAACWDKDAFRGVLFDWIESLGLLTAAEKKKTLPTLFMEMRAGARKASVETVPDPTEKKTKAKSRVTSRS